MSRIIVLESRGEGTEVIDGAEVKQAKPMQVNDEVSDIKQRIVLAELIEV